MRGRKISRREFLKLPLIVIIPFIHRKGKGKTLKRFLFKKKTPAG